MYVEDCDAEPQTTAENTYFKLEPETDDSSDFYGWYDCGESPEACDLQHKRNQSFYLPRPNSWMRVSHWAFMGVGECLLRREVATASLDQDTLTIETREYRDSIQGVSDPANCNRSAAVSVAATPTNCGRRVSQTATLVDE